MLCGLPRKEQSCTAEDTKKGDTITAQGNRRADRVAKLATAGEMSSPTAFTAPLFPSPSDEWDPKYSPQGETWF